MRYIIAMIGGLCISVLCQPGCTTATPQAEGAQIAKEFIAMADKYLVDVEGNRLEVKSTCVVWIGRKTGLQPVESYTCFHYWFLTNEDAGGEAAVVVDVNEYESVVLLKQRLKSIEGQQAGLSAFPRCKIRFARYSEVSHLAIDRGTTSERPAPNDIVGVIEPSEANLE